MDGMDSATAICIGVWTTQLPNTKGMDMTLLQAIRILEHHNQWRQGADVPQADPKLITEAIEIAINILKGISK